ncbi:AAA-like domain-containing protein [Azoarcus sp. DN11]|uniref:AAA-like domain-containing protein n=1 Tax=Azoarcus sp. DN11 TaxID=356837 RepID=UPI000EB32E9D|nr:AAA-like domain-containing protein [Azoarcus sp. DN11]AYH43255.1 hypothetical protein CDA09_07625 [Azoarcus sp. DN11]
MDHQVFISYSQRDRSHAATICANLEQDGIPCWIAPRDIPGGQHWDETIMDAIPRSRVLLVIISSHSDRSLHVKRELSLAAEHAVSILPVRVEDVVPQRLRYYLGTCQWVDAHPVPIEAHREMLCAAVRRLLAEGAAACRGDVLDMEVAVPPLDEPARTALEPPTGAVQVDSPFYVERAVDAEFHAAVARQDSLVLLKGARQVGKTSLLAQGVHRARAAERRVVWTDLQTLNASQLASLDYLYQSLARMLADQLGLAVRPETDWDPHLGPNRNFERFMLQEVLERVTGPLVWAIDEADRLIGCEFADEVFGLLRTWHNARAIDRNAAWSRLTVAIAYATEAHLLMEDPLPAPFNVGTQLALEDFNFEQVLHLNQCYGAPLRSDAELAGFYRLVGGHPYLVRNGLHRMATARLGLAALEQQSCLDDGPFGEHLRRLLIALHSDRGLGETVREVLRGRSSPSAQHFYRLRSAGIFAGNSVQDARPRCQLYAAYLERHLP